MEEVQRPSELAQGPAETCATVSSVPLESWMSMLPAEMRGASLCELALPGAHNSGAHAVLKVPEEFLARHVGELVASWSFVSAIVAPIAKWSAVCQDLPVAELLRAGVRALDFRLGLCDDEVYVCHTVICTVSWRQVLAEVADFLRANTSEVVVIMAKRDWEHKFFGTPENWARVQRDMAEILGELLCNDPQALTLPIDELCARGQRVVPMLEVPAALEQTVGVPMSGANLKKSWHADTQTVEAMVHVIGLWRDLGLTKPQRGILKFLEIALPGNPRRHAPRANEEFRNFLAEGDLRIGAMLDFPDEATVRALLANNWAAASEATAAAAAA